jgi:hypothetical protein
VVSQDFVSSKKAVAAGGNQMMVVQAMLFLADARAIVGDRARLRGLVGLDKGAVTPESIALAIVSEIHAWGMPTTILTAWSFEQSRLFFRTELEHKRNAARTTVRSNAPRVRDRRPLQGRESGKGGI